MLCSNCHYPRAPYIPPPSARGWKGSAKFPDSGRRCYATSGCAYCALSPPSPSSLCLLRPLWQDGFRYSKAGVMLNDLRPAEGEPRSLFPTRDPARSARTMAALDAVNTRFGRGTLGPLATGIARAWKAAGTAVAPLHDSA